MAEDTMARMMAMDAMNSSGTSGVPFTQDDKDKLDAITNDREKKFELIETISIDEQDVVKIDRTMETDGTPYDFEKLMYEIELPETFASTGSSAVRCSTNWKNGTTAHHPFSSTAMYSRALLKIENGFGFSMTTFPSTVKTNNTGLYTYASGFGINANNISKLEFSSDAPFPVGTTITIYAVRRD